MLSFPKSKISSSKAYVSNGSLLDYVDTRQPPSKKPPYSTILNQPFTHKIELQLPEELYNLIWEDVAVKIRSLQYSRVIMPLSALLEGEFFNVYIKRGNILMLSEGRPGVDDKYSLKDGLLRLDLAKENYERCGLVGKPIQDQGRKHIKSRFSVEINLRLPSMLHGKKGFERIVWAFKNVLDHSLTWLFHDFEMPSDLTMTRPIAKHHPSTHTCSPDMKTIRQVLAPNMKHLQIRESEDNFAHWCLEIHEWISLVALGSPRVLQTDSIDPFLSRYHVPDADPEHCLNLVTVTWTGLIPAAWIRSLFIELNTELLRLKSKKGADNFFALSGYAFPTVAKLQPDGYTILSLANVTNERYADADIAENSDPKVVPHLTRDYILWESISH